MQARDVEAVIPPGAFYNRVQEWELYNPLMGDSMLELGGKVNQPFTYKSTFTALGFRHVSVDWNGDHQALPLDLRHPISLGTFDMVTNIGTSEHVDDQRGVWQNLVEACHIGSVLISTTPLLGSWWWHAEHFPTREFYKELAARNGFFIDRLYIEFEPPKEMIFCRMTRTEIVPFVMPDLRLIAHNEIRPR